MRMCVAFRRRCRAWSRVVTEPISTSPPPEGNLVKRVHADVHRQDSASPGSSAKALKAMPAPQVLSSAVSTPLARAVRTSAGRSGNSIVIEPAASSHTSRVAGPIIAASACGIRRVVEPRYVMPQRDSSCCASSLPGP